MQKTKTYFASDFHLGVPDHQSSIERERIIVSWLNEIRESADSLYLMGDLFDFWFEYKKAVPRGFVRLLGKLGELVDDGLKLTVFTGNHDLWMRDYLETELFAEVIREPVIREIGEKRFYLAHGDGLGPGDHGFKFMKSIFKNPFCQWAFRQVHPDVGIGVADYFSRRSRKVNGDADARFLGEEKEWLIVHSKNLLEQQPINYFIYGHRHYPLKLQLAENSYYINLGDWISHFTYAEFDGKVLDLKKYEN